MPGFCNPTDHRTWIKELFRKHELFSHIAVVIGESEAHGFIQNDMPLIVVEGSLATVAELVRILRLRKYAVVFRESQVFSEPLYSSDEVLEDLDRWVDASALKKFSSDFDRGVTSDAYVCLRGLAMRAQRRLRGWKPKHSEIAGPRIEIDETATGKKGAVKKRIIRWEQMAQTLMDM